MWISQIHSAFINTKTAARLLLDVLATDVRSERINLSARGKVLVSDIFAMFGEHPSSGFDKAEINYELNVEKLEKILGRSVPTSFEEVKNYRI